jgi:hypothetical protein
MQIGGPAELRTMTARVSLTMIVKTEAATRGCVRVARVVDRATGKSWRRQEYVPRICTVRMQTWLV